jgi:hypothetical protein
MGWWWELLIAPNNLYSLFSPVAAFTKDVDWQEEAFKQTTPTFAYVNPPKAPVISDLVFQSGPVEWRPSAYNQPLTVTIRGGKVSGQSMLAGIQHGLRDHPELNNPVTFDVEVAKPTRFDVVVTDVSGYSGANLRIWLDNKLVVTKDFIDPDGNEKVDNLKQYAGKYGLTIPAGRHIVRVQNQGADWFLASFRFAGLVKQTKPPVQGWAIVGETKSLAWIRREGRNWPAATKGQSGLTPPIVFGLSGLASGSWTAEIWDTWTGKVLQSNKVTVPIAGRVRVNLPKFAGDIAVKLTKS